MIAIRSNKDDRSRYKQLLANEWDEDFADDVVSLLWEMIKGNNAWIQAANSVLDPKGKGPFPPDLMNTLFAPLVNQSQLVRNLGVEIRLPKSYSLPVRPSKAALRAVRLAAYLSLGMHDSLSGDIALFVDVQSLAFQAAVEFVLPDLKDAHSKPPVERSILVHAAFIPPLSLSVEVAQAMYMLSALFGHLGFSDRHLDFLQNSVRLTPVSDHSYLTRVQDYWTELLDAKRYDDAESFLLDVHGQCLPGQREEVREMISEAYEFILQHKVSK